MTPINRLILNFNIAANAVMSNFFRSVLTALGIIFGVAAVIAMLAIGRGAQEEILEQIKLVGVNNIMVTPLDMKENSGSNDGIGKEMIKKYSPGLNLKDAHSIDEIIPHVETISPEIEKEVFAMRNGVRESVNLIGVWPQYFDTYNFSIKKGNGISDAQNQKAASICVIGKGVEARFFNSENAVGSYLKCGNHWFKVVGVTEKIMASTQSRELLDVRDFDRDVYIPLQTYISRFGHRENTANEEDEDEEGGAKGIDHQLNRITVQMKESHLLLDASDVINRMLFRRHNQLGDVKIDVPIMMLRQQQKTKDIFNIVLGCIAGISLLVGGIGIMNIMLASVYERIKEIGIRMAMGATQKDIIQQFLLEAVIISLSGGLIGVIVGVGISFGISALTDIKTIVSVSSVVISFGVSATVGLIFGLMPARKAAKQDPINSLRYE